MNFKLKPKKVIKFGKENKEKLIFLGYRIKEELSSPINTQQFSHYRETAYYEGVGVVFNPPQDFQVDWDHVGL